MTTITLIIEISCPFQKINHKKHKPDDRINCLCRKRAFLAGRSRKMTVLINILKSGHF
ncbi:hypothetical protein HMPREF1617_03126 [Escherichia coli 908675]|nr:hypothetical protein HMPREF9539_00697 [Escherichia coli MS 110-3]EFU58096.1 hypothetical protein HMPREF9545_02131 [Escherichia coli MS 16-3]ESE14995.1 hypothetical protein HMPREF1617_03126 [Escherichia coli 908675]